MKVLFIGGTGIISSACSELAVSKGIELTFFNRGQTGRPVPKGVRVLHGDIRDTASAKQILKDEKFDAVVDWIAFIPDHVEADIELFRNSTDQYIFISSASAYQTPPKKLPVTESTPLGNPFWEYSRNKIACEKRLTRAYHENRFPVTIVRPSHTYDERTLPFHGRYAVIDRMRKGKKVIVHGDGTSIWVLTHHRDFAGGFVGLLGNPKAVGETFHITSDELLTWNQIYTIMAEAAGTEPDMIHVPSEIIAAFDKEWGDNLLGDKSHSMIFDNSKIKRTVPDFEARIPFSEGAREIMRWFDADPSRQIVDEKFNQLCERIISAYQSSWRDIK
jgi:nucleoside-diphosphate-sugar epimerase